LTAYHGLTSEQPVGGQFVQPQGTHLGSVQSHQVPLDNLSSFHPRVGYYLGMLVCELFYAAWQPDISLIPRLDPVPFPRFISPASFGPVGASPIQQSAQFSERIGNAIPVQPSSYSPPPHLPYPGPTPDPECDPRSPPLPLENNLPKQIQPVTPPSSSHAIIHTSQCDSTDVCEILPTHNPDYSHPAAI